MSVAGPGTEEGGVLASEICPSSCGGCGFTAGGTGAFAAGVCTTGVVVGVGAGGGTTGFAVGGTCIFVAGACTGGAVAGMAGAGMIGGVAGFAMGGFIGCFAAGDGAADTAGVADFLMVLTVFSAGFVTSFSSDLTGFGFSFSTSLGLGFGLGFFLGCSFAMGLAGLVAFTAGVLAGVAFLPDKSSTLGTGEPSGALTASVLPTSPGDLESIVVPVAAGCGAGD